MSHFKLDIKEVERDFFGGKSLLAVSAPGVSNHHFCWMLDYYLGLSLLRQPDLDVLLESQKGKTRNEPSLFQVPPVQKPCFPVYRHQIEGTAYDLLLYGNRSRGQNLIPEIKSADFFLLYPGDSLIGMEQKLSYCRRLKGVSWMEKQNIDKLVSKDAFIL